MIRITTDAKLAQGRRDLAGQIAEAVERLTPEEDCPHANNRPSCPRCAERRTVLAAAAVVRETGGVAQRGESRDA